MREYLKTSLEYEKQYAEMPIFDANEGVGVKWEYENKIYTAAIGNGNVRKKRKVVLEISSWLGQDADARHYYGKLFTDGLFFDNGTLSSSGQPGR